MATNTVHESGDTPDSNFVHVRAESGYQVWQMVAEPVNALSPGMLSALDGHLTQAVADDSVAVVLLTSGLPVFSGGADATWMRTVVEEVGPQGLLEQFIRTMDRFRELSVRIRRSPLLVIAALGGHTLAGGLELAAACDLRFAADNEKIRIGVPEMDLFGAMPSGGGGVQFLTRLMGPSRALDFVLNAKPVSPARAFDLGLVDRLYPADELLVASERFAGEVAKKALRVGVAAAKRAMLDGAELPLYEALEFDRGIHWDTLRRGRFFDGVAAFTAQFASSKK
jgi:enoyl-CoA hydratase